MFSGYLHLIKSRKRCTDGCTEEILSGGKEKESVKEKARSSFMSFVPEYENMMLIHARVRDAMHPLT